MGGGSKDRVDPLLFEELKVEELEEFVIGETIPCRTHASVSVGVEGGADCIEAGEWHGGWVIGYLGLAVWICKLRESLELRLKGCFSRVSSAYLVYRGGQE